MTVVAERLKSLRESIGISQNKMCTINLCTQSSLNRYENGQSTPPLELLVWYADYFDVSLDYIFARTDNPQGKLYECKNQYAESDEKMRQFVEMCFDPKSPMNSRLKNMMMEVITEKGEE